jgi:carboxyl-terminal processing protease
MARALAVLLALAAAVQASDATLRTFDACCAAVERHFYDKDVLARRDWPAIKSRYRPQADRAAPGAELHRVLNAMLGELRVSHAAILEKDVHTALVAELRNRSATTWGITFEETRPGHLFVRTLFEEGPGVRAGLRLGDRIVRIGPHPALESPRLLPAGYDPTSPGPPLYSIRLDGEVKLPLAVQRRAGGPVRELAVFRGAMNGVDAARASVRVVERDGFRLGTLHVWYCQPGIPEVVEAALTGELEDCDALVLDLRGRGGFSAVSRALRDLFAPRWWGQAAPVWPKPVVFLIDGRTRSAKEVLAYYLRRDHLGLIVGERTEGAVLAAGFFPLPDGSFVELPVRDVEVDGKRLEGVGVPPHIEAKLDLPYADGKDGIFERGCAAAVEEIRRWQRLRKRII